MRPPDTTLRAYLSDLRTLPADRRMSVLGPSQQFAVMQQLAGSGRWSRWSIWQSSVFLAVETLDHHQNDQTTGQCS